MNRIRTIAVIGALSLGLAGCMSSGSKEEAGTLVGAVGGGLIGGAATGTTGGVLVGALAGGLIGNAIGADLDAADRRAALDAEFRALEYGRVGAPVQWRGSSGRHYGDVVAGTRYQVNDFACRDYTHTIYINGQPQIARGTACRQQDGTWKAVG
jgi:surface antigen